ncbi:MAG: ACT domain-containing protein [Eubacteriales bacterium]|nr:ACT domain-containing protein [Eubacteriales bacterium]
MRAVLTVIGHDKVGIIYRVSELLASCNVNIADITQTILQDYFTMIMIVETDACNCSFKELQEKLDALGTTLEMSIRLQHEDIFNSMHRI